MISCDKGLKIKFKKRGGKVKGEESFKTTLKVVVSDLSYKSDNLERSEILFNSEE